MAFKFSKRDQVRKTELLAQAREKHSFLCERIEAFNAQVAAARGSVEAAANEYGQAVAQLQQFAHAMAEEQGQVFAGRKDRWKDGESGEAVRGWIDAYYAFRPKTPETELPAEIEHPDDDLLSDYEELPDAP
jgi:hypothetical protein